MALRGNLRDFSVTQLLNLINLAKKTGTLIIEGPSETAQIAFRDGKLAYAQIGQEDNRLATVLYRASKLSQGQFRAIQARAAQLSDKELGLLLINAGYISQEDILTNLQVYPPEDRINIRLDLENLIIEGSRQLREWEQLQDEIPSLDLALKFTDRPGTNIRNVNLSVEEWRVVSYISPRNSMRQIAVAAKLNDLEIRRIVYGLIQAGLVELMRPEGASATTRESARPTPPVDKEEQKSLVNRLITRIRAM
jgi:hypothetical protein